MLFINFQLVSYFGSSPQTKGGGFPSAISGREDGGVESPDHIGGN